MKGVGPSSCESSDVCAGSLVAVDCAVVWTEVASVEELVDEALGISRVAEVAEVSSLVAACVVVESAVVVVVPGLVMNVAPEVVVLEVSLVVWDVVLAVVVAPGTVENPCVVPGCTVVVIVVA